MIHVSIPRKPRVEGKSNIKDFIQMQSLLSKHGFAISYFGREGVSFFDRTKCTTETTVPISSFFKMTQKEFRVFVEVIKRLDDCEKEKSDMIKFINGR